jgi:putative transposase
MRGWPLSRHLDQTRTLTALRGALVPQRPDRHHADQGVPSAAPASVPTRRARGLQISMATVGDATEKGSAERLRRTLNDAAVALHADPDVHEAYHSLGPFLHDVYQHQRMHAAWGSLTPAEFAAHWVQQEPLAVAMT